MAITHWIRGGLLAALLAAGTAGAATFRFADQGDPISMDPHSLNESFQLNFTGNIYEPLVGRGKKLELVPLLATSWKQIGPTTWRFELRRNVRFHDGTPATTRGTIEKSPGVYEYCDEIVSRVHAKGFGIMSMLSGSSSTEVSKWESTE